MYTIHAAKGPLAEAQIISLTFDYQVNPIDTVEITYVDINTSLQVIIKFRNEIRSANVHFFILFFAEPMFDQFSHCRVR